MSQTKRIQIIVFMSLPFLIVHCAKETKQEHAEFRSSAEAGVDTSLLALSAKLLYDANLYHEASIEYDKLSKLDSSNGKYVFRRAYCLLQVDSLEEAKRYYFKSARLMYKEAECYYAIGAIFVMMDMQSSAVPFLHKALELDPNMEKAIDLLFEVENGIVQSS